MPRPVRRLLPHGVIVLLAYLLIAGGGTPSAPSVAVHLAAERGDAVARSAGRTLRLPSASRCVRGGRLSMRFISPSATGLSRIRIFADGVEAVRLEGIFLGGRAMLRLPSGRTRVVVTGMTIAGNPVAARRTYVRCRRSRDADVVDDKQPIIFEGGGED